MNGPFGCPCCRYNADNLDHLITHMRYMKTEKVTKLPHNLNDLLRIPKY
jgi:hypothetical protein